MQSPMGRVQPFGADELMYVRGTTLIIGAFPFGKLGTRWGVVIRCGFRSGGRPQSPTGGLNGGAVECRRPDVDNLRRVARSSTSVAGCIAS